jgi:hypothetical protein
LQQDIDDHNLANSINDQQHDDVVVDNGQRRQCHGLSAIEIMAIDCRPYGVCGVVSVNKDGLCGICLESMTNETLVVDFPSCGHIFHAHCLLPWFIRARTCPTCRRVWPFLPLSPLPLSLHANVDAALRINCVNQQQQQ